MTKKDSKLRFLANSLPVETEAWRGSPALDFIRRDLALTGTKEGCREGDCGACAVLVGERLASGPGQAPWVRYRAMPSCLLALGDLEEAHLLTIEGLREAAASGITPVMRAMLDENGSQCGFCSPGIVVSLTAFLLEGPPYSIESAIVAVEGNLCRCTGYGAIKRAAARLVAEFSSLPTDFLARVAELEKAAVIPASVGAFARGELLPANVAAAQTQPPGSQTAQPAPGAGPALVIAGGSDFFVRNPKPDRREPLALLARDEDLRGIVEFPGGIEVGAAVAWRDFFSSPLVRSCVSGIGAFEGALASILVRNRATVGGNVANASPVGDLTSILLALAAVARLRGPHGERELPLERLFLGYKKLDLLPGEIIASFLIGRAPGRVFNFEKIAKRANLDIAAVNSAACIELEAQPGRPRIARARISAGGVAAVPLLLEKTSRLLVGREAEASTALAAMRQAMAEVSPIDDARGSAEYRKKILGRLVLAHFIALFPELEAELAREVLA